MAQCFLPYSDKKFFFTFSVHLIRIMCTQPFNGPLSRTSRVGRYQQKHSPTDHQTSFVNFLRLLQSTLFSLFNLRAWQSFSTTSLQVLFGLPLGLGPSTSYSILLLHPFNGLFSRTTWVSRYQKGKTSRDLNEAREDGVLGCSGVSWTICKHSAPRSRQIPTPAPHSPCSGGCLVVVLHCWVCGWGSIAVCADGGTTMHDWCVQWMLVLCGRPPTVCCRLSRVSGSGSTSELKN